MASLPAAGMISLGKDQGREGYGSARILEAFTKVEGDKFSSRLANPKRHVVSADSVETTKILDLNIKELRHTTGKHLLDIVPNYEGEIDESAVCALMKDNNYSSLPPTFNEKQPINKLYHMQVNMSKQENGKWLVVKWFIFEEKQIFASIVDKLIHGLAFQPTWTSPAFVFHVMKLLQWLFERLPGTSMLYMTWASDNTSQNKQKKTEQLDNDSRRAGYDYIRKHGPKANNLNQFVEWTDMEVNNPASPIMGWCEGRVKESLSNYAKGSSAAKTIERWAVSIRKFYPQILDNLVIPAIRTHHVNAIWMIGKSRVGKSTASKTMGMTISGHQIEKHGRTDLVPSVITCKKIDALRLEPGSKFKPAICDDIPTAKMEADELKAVGDPGEEDAWLWARWNGVSLEQNQHRELCTNPYDMVYEATVNVTTVGGVDHISHADFVRIFEISFPKPSTEADVEAYLNRYHIFLLTDKHIYYRFAGGGSAAVRRMTWPNPSKPDLFIPETTGVLKQYKKDQAYKPADYDEDFRWGVNLLHALANEQQIPRTITITGPTLFGDGRPVTVYRHPPLDTPVMMPPASPAIIPSTAPCGNPSDQAELQLILRKKTLDADLDGCVIDLVSPSRSPRGHPVSTSFCGDTGDALELRKIFRVLSQRLAGQVISIDDDDKVKSPPRKKKIH